MGCFGGSGAAAGGGGGGNANSPVGKKLDWFLSEAGLAAFREYMQAKNFLVEEDLRKEYKESGKDCGFGIYLTVWKNNPKVPFVYFKNFIDNIKVQPLEYIGPIRAVVEDLEDFARPYEMGDDGEPVAVEPKMEPRLLLNVNRNPLLYFVKNFNAFKLEDDDEGSWDDKWDLYYGMLSAITVFVNDFNVNNMEWALDKSLFINDLGRVRKLKGFFQRCKNVSGLDRCFDIMLETWCKED